MKCTLKDIASATGYTVNTVSHALHGKSDISKSTKEKIKQKAEEMGYIPNVAASSLRNGYSKMFAILYDNIMNPYYSVVTSLVNEYCKKYGYSLMIFTDTVFPFVSDEVSHKILSHNVDGLISFKEITPETKKLFDYYNMPVIILGRDGSKNGVDSICSDDEKGGYLATNHLINCGYKNILMLNILEDIECAQRRKKGYIRALSEAELYNQKILSFNEEAQNCSEIIDKVLYDKIKFDAVFAFNDMMAFETIVKLNSLGIKVPDDIGVIGFDNIQDDLKFPCRLSTIDNDKKQIAEVAVEVLYAKIKDNKLKHKAFNKILDVSLVKGETTIIKN
jgi:LacI family transcriptional regulator